MTRLGLQQNQVFYQSSQIWARKPIHISSVFSKMLSLGCVIEDQKKTTTGETKKYQ